VNNCFVGMQSLVGHASAQAVLDLDTASDDEPFNSAVTFGCIPPGKRYQPVDELSGGEKTIAALTLLFAMQS